MKNRAIAIAFSLLLMFAMAIWLVAIPTADAHDPAWEITTYAFIHVAPDPVGQGQTVSVLMWLDKVIGGANEGNAIRFEDYKLTITDPDGHTEIETWDIVHDTTSSQYYAYVPSKTGKYTFKFEFPGQTYDFGGDYEGSEGYWPSNAETAINVEEAPATTPVPTPVPQESVGTYFTISTVLIIVAIAIVAFLILRRR